MPWAVEGTISHSPLEGGILITDAQYDTALAALIDGKLVLVSDGKLTISDPPAPIEPEPPAPADPLTLPIWKYTFWLAVHDAFGLTKDQVVAAIDTSDLAPDVKYLAKLGIEDAQTYRRDDPNVIVLLSLMGYTQEEADAFWRWAQPTF